jgi:membrane associated rhomboid family serine protease
LGASGAIAGVMGGFLLLYPRARVVTLVFIIIFITTFELPAAFMLLYWFAIQLLSGLQSVNSLAGRGFTDSGGVAWFAHVGGFLAGLFLIRIFAGSGRGRPRYSY